MISAQTLLAFLGVSLLLGLTPGPDNVFVLMQSAAHGRKAGFLVVLGLCAGLVVHTVAVALGLAAVFAASASAFVVLKFVGAAYLARLAWLAWRAPVTAGELGASAVQRSGQLLTRGMIMNLTNPKVVLFFLAFLPQFVEPQRGAIALQICVLGAVFMLATLITFGTISFFAASLGQRLRGSASAQRLMNRVTSVVFTGLALRLAVAQR